MTEVLFPIPKMRRRGVAAAHRQVLSEMSVGEFEVFPIIDRVIIARVAREMGCVITTKQIDKERIRVWLVSKSQGA